MAHLHVVGKLAYFLLIIIDPSFMKFSINPEVFWVDFYILFASSSKFRVGRIYEL